MSHYGLLHYLKAKSIQRAVRTMCDRSNVDKTNVNGVSDVRANVV